MSNKKERSIWFLGSSSFFNDFGSEMIAIILPFFVVSLGGAGLAVGALSGLREGLASIFKLFGGWYSDRLGKRMPFVFFGYIISVILRLLLALSNSTYFILGLASLERLGKSRDAPRDAIISDLTKRRGHGFGVQQMLDTAGAIIGSLAVLFLFWKLGFGFRTIILIAGGVSVLSIVPLFFVKEPRIKPEKRSLLGGLSKIDNRLKYFLLVAGVFTLANFGLYMFLLLRAREITGSIVVAIALGILFNFVWALFTIPFGNLSDKIGKKKVLLAGYILFFFVSLGFVYLTGLFSLILLFIFYALVYAITKANQTALVADLSDSMRGTSLGFYQFVIGLASIAGGIIAGLLWDISYQTMFFYISLIALISIVLLIFVRE